MTKSMSSSTVEELEQNRLHNQQLKKAKSHLLERQRAYKRVFDDKNKAVKAVLEDLGMFCRAYRSCFDPDARIHAVFEGRREVILRIEDHLKLSQEELWKQYRGDQSDE